MPDEVCMQNALTPILLCSWICIGLWMTVSGHILSPQVHSNILSWASEESQTKETAATQQQDSGYIKTGRRVSNMIVNTFVLPPQATVYDEAADDEVFDTNRSDTTAQPSAERRKTSARKLTGISRHRYSSTLTAPQAMNPTTGTKKRGSIASYLTGMYSSGYLSIPEGVDEEEGSATTVRRGTAIIEQPEATSRSTKGTHRVSAIMKQGQRSKSTLR